MRMVCGSVAASVNSGVASQRGVALASRRIFITRGYAMSSPRALDAPDFGS